MKSAAERITRGKGNFINCTDYDDAVKAINETASEVRSEMLEFAEWCMDAKNILFRDNDDYEFIVPKSRFEFEAVEKKI